MVCDGPDPPEHTPEELTPPPVFYLMNGQQADDSEEETSDYEGYEPLPQGPDHIVPNVRYIEDEDANNDTEPQDTAVEAVPSIEPMENQLTREVWSTPRTTDPIEMDGDKAQQVMSAMANFVLPPTAIPQWARCVPEEQWKQTLSERLDKLNNK